MKTYLSKVQGLLCWFIIENLWDTNGVVKEEFRPGATIEYLAFISMGQSWQHGEALDIKWQTYDASVRKSDAYVPSKTTKLNRYSS